jgi:hypothetical protein
MYGGSSVIDATGTTPADASLVCTVFHGASSAIYVGGSLGTPAATGNPGSDPMKRICLGNITEGFKPLNGKIAAVIVSAGAHDASKRAQYAFYLSKFFP